MTANNFKSKLTEIKNFLFGKQIVLSLVTEKGIDKFTFQTLKAFGNKVLDLENQGAGFSFSKVANDLTEQRIVTEKELTKWTKQGAWKVIHVSASTL